MNDNLVADTKAEYTRAKERIIHLLATTPDDKIHASPSSTARTPIQLVAHAAMGVADVQGMLESKPFPYTSPAEYDAASRRREKEYTTRAQALALLEQISAEYFLYLDTLTPAQLTATVSTPFGPFAMPASLAIAADHIRGHARQLDYLQTTWGDTDWHL